MENSLEFEIGIIDYRNIIKVIKETYNYDFSDYALISLKRRFENVIQKHNFKYHDLLIEKLRHDEVFFQNFLKEISVESTEMFRDPALWRNLRDELLPKIFQENLKPKIWLPFCISGDELFTLAIILKELNRLENAEIIATSINDLTINDIKKGNFQSFKTDVSRDNYIRYQGKKQFSDYYNVNGEQVVRDNSLIRNVNFIKQNINFDNSPQNITLILCRNQFIYFTQTFHDKTLKVFYDSLTTGGYLVLGIKEQVGILSSKYFRLINDTESIYKKI